MAGQWIKWSGGVRPVKPDSDVQVCLRLVLKCKAREMDWAHRAETPGSNIVAYQLLDDPDENPPLPGPEETAEFDELLGPGLPERPAELPPTGGQVAGVRPPISGDETAVALDTAVEAMKTVRRRAGRLRALRAWLGVGRRALA